MKLIKGIVAIVCIYYLPILRSAEHIQYNTLVHGCDSIGTHYTMNGFLEDKYIEIYVRSASGIYIGHSRTYSEEITTLSSQEAKYFFTEFEALYKNRQVKVQAQAN